MGRDVAILFILFSVVCQMLLPVTSRHHPLFRRRHHPVLKTLLMSR